MWLQHAKQAASGLSTDEPRRIQAQTKIVEEVERRHWRIWNGNARYAQLTLERIREVMHVFKGERGHWTRGVTSRKLWHALHEVDNYLRGSTPGSSTIPNDIARVWELELSRPELPLTSWSLGG